MPAKQHKKNLKISYLFFPFLFLPVWLHAQDPGKDYTNALDELKLKEYSIITKTDTIRFLATLPGKKKKTIVFVGDRVRSHLLQKCRKGCSRHFLFCWTVLQGLHLIL
jgi:hypothetical protein